MRAETKIHRCYLARPNCYERDYLNYFELHDQTLSIHPAFPHLKSAVVVCFSGSLMKYWLKSLLGRHHPDGVTDLQ